ncbi:MAG: SsrA-binding protein SmpB [Armatimonadetes bacterium]|nr:SsrA-binding protein SmpB [Armatimonadota bacterium]
MASQTVATNRKARHEYHIEDAVEAGIVLTGPEVKSVRARRVSLAEAYAQVQDGQVIIHNMHIARYDAGGIHVAQSPTRPRKLLLHKREIRRLERAVREKGVTLIPLRMYFNDRGYAKIELGLCRGKRQYEKREAIKARDEQRRTDQAVRDYQRGR